MAALPDGLTQAEVDRYLKLDLVIKKAKAEHEVLNEKIKNAHAAKKAGTYVYGDTVLVISDTTSFDTDGFEADYPYAANKTVYKHVVDTKAIAADTRKAYMTPAARRMGVSKAN